MMTKCRLKKETFDKKVNFKTSRRLHLEVRWVHISVEAG